MPPQRRGHLVSYATTCLVHCGVLQVSSFAAPGLRRCGGASAVCLSTSTSFADKERRDTSFSGTTRRLHRTAMELTAGGEVRAGNLLAFRWAAMEVGVEGVVAVSWLS